MNGLMKRLGAAVLAIAVTAPLALADDHEGGDHEMMIDKASTKGQMLFWISDAEDKLLQLAEATPEDKYSWRPGEGVRSTAEVFMHVCGANFGIPTMWGATAPEGFSFKDYDKSMTKKAEIIPNLKASFAHVKKALVETDEATMKKDVNLFGQMDTTVLGGYMLIVSHVHEHLGQSIAYARTNGIVPPWSAKQAAAAAKAKAAAAEKKDE